MIIGSYASSTDDPKILLGIGLLCTICGIIFIRRAIQGDTLIPGTLWTHFPRSLFIFLGIILQIPLPAAYFFLRHQGIL